MTLAPVIICRLVFPLAPWRPGAWHYEYVASETHGFLLDDDGINRQPLGGAVRLADYPDVERVSD